MTNQFGHSAPNSTRISASLWSVPPQEQRNTLNRLKTAGLDVVHWDMTDGDFAAPGGFHASRARSLTSSAGVRAEAHLMVTEPTLHVDAWTDFCELVVVHVESNNWREALNRIESRGSQPALALSPGTPTSKVLSQELAVLVMAITPGQAGSEFDRSCLTKVATLSATGPLLGIDGGVTAALAVEGRAAGANWLISGTDLCGSADPQQWLRTVRDG